jgi:hypothetical protein
MARPVPRDRDCGDRRAGGLSRLLLAVVRIRDRHAFRYAALALGLGAGGTFILLEDVGFAEAFHFVEYGVLAMLFYRACATFDDAAFIVVPLLACVIVGALDEWFQWFIPYSHGGRSATSCSTSSRQGAGCCSPWLRVRPGI